MNYNVFIDKEIINKNNQVGVVLSFDKDHIIIRYTSEEKTYNPDVAFKTGFLAFKDKCLKSLIDQDLFKKDEAEKKKEEEKSENHRKCVSKRKKVNETYKRMCAKNRMLRALFGSDFVYPPLKEFEKKYKNSIDKSIKYKDLYLDCLYGPYTTPWYYND